MTLEVAQIMGDDQGVVSDMLDNELSGAGGDALDILSLADNSNWLKGPVTPRDGGEQT